jgi:uncharacterized membrane protein
MCACQVTALSADGSAATGLLDNESAPFRWTIDKGVKSLGRSTLKFIGNGAGTPSISDDGTVIAATIIDSTHTYGTNGRWSVGNGWQELGVPPDGGLLDGFDSSAWGISGDGTTVVGLYWRPGQTGGSAHGSVWTAATGTIGLPTDGRSARLNGANHDGTVLVGWEQDAQTGVRRAIVWKGGVKTYIDDGGGVGYPSEASAVNSDGTIVVGQAIDTTVWQEEAAMWKWDGAAWQKTTLGLGPNSDTDGSSYAVGVSDDGATVVGWYRPVFGPSTGGYVWTQDAGLVDAEAWMDARGKHVEKRQHVFTVGAISRDGRVLAMAAMANAAPFAIHSLRVQQLDASRAK